MIVNRELKWTYGTGIHTVSPAHNVEDLRLSYAYQLPRSGCIDSETGFLTRPQELAGTDISGAEKDACQSVKALLKDHGQFYATIPN